MKFQRWTILPTLPAFLEPENLQKKVFAQLLLSSGYESMEGKVSMTWNKIISTAGPFDEENYSLCRTVFTPDHLLVSHLNVPLYISNERGFVQQEVILLSARTYLTRILLKTQLEYYSYQLFKLFRLRPAVPNHK